METPDELTNTMQRGHSEFESFIELEKSKAKYVFDSDLIQGKITPSFAYEYSSDIDRMEQLSELINYEIKRANGVFFEKYTIE